MATVQDQSQKATTKKTVEGVRKPIVTAKDAQAPAPQPVFLDWAAI